jgi:hypothetical protein
MESFQNFSISTASQWRRAGGAELVVLILVLMASAAGVTWQMQEWRMGKRLAEQAGLHQGELAGVSAAAAKQGNPP